MKCHDEGFTLVEVLVAFAIMAGAIIMAFSVFGDGLRGLKLVQERSHQVQMAQRQIDLASAATNIHEGTTLITEENVKLRVVLQVLRGFEGDQKFVQKPFKIEVFFDNTKNSTTPILETIILAKSFQP